MRSVAPHLSNAASCPSAPASTVTDSSMWGRGRRVWRSTNGSLVGESTEKRPPTISSILLRRVRPSPAPSTRERRARGVPDGCAEKAGAAREEAARVCVRVCVCALFVPDVMAAPATPGAPRWNNPGETSIHVWWQPAPGLTAQVLEVREGSRRALSRCVCVWGVRLRRTHSCEMMREGTTAALHIRTHVAAPASSACMDGCNDG